MVMMTAVMVIMLLTDGDDADDDGDDDADGDL